MSRLFTILCGAAFIVLLTSSGCKSKNEDQQEIDAAWMKTTILIDGQDSIVRQKDLYDAKDNLLATYILSARRIDTVTSAIYSYDKEGLKRVTTYAHGKITHEELHTRVGGRLLHVVETDGADTLSITDYTYYSTGVMMREVKQYVYDSDAPVTIVTNYEKTGLKSSIFKQIYEDSSRIVLTRYEMDKFTHQFDQQKRLIRTQSIFQFGYYEEADSTLDNRYVYNDKNQLIEENHAIKSAVDMPDKITYTYDEAGNMTSATYFAKTKPEYPFPDLIWSKKYTYDSQNRLTSETTSDDATHILYRYTQLK